MSEIGEERHDLKCACDFETELVVLDADTMQCPRCKRVFRFGMVVMTNELREAERALRKSLAYLFAVPGVRVPGRLPVVGYDSEEVKLGLW
jgi:hypothetical protein